MMFPKWSHSTWFKWLFSSAFLVVFPIAFFTIAWNPFFSFFFPLFSLSLSLFFTWNLFRSIAIELQRGCIKEVQQILIIFMVDEPVLCLWCTVMYWAGLRCAGLLDLFLCFSDNMHKWAVSSSDRRHGSCTSRPQMFSPLPLPCGKM